MQINKIINILVKDSDTGGPSSINLRIEYVFAFQI